MMMMMRRMMMMKMVMMKSPSADSKVSLIDKTLEQP